MLNIIYGRLSDDNFIYDPSWYFDINYESEWFEDEFIREMILDVDGSTVEKGEVIISQIFGAIPPQKLSGGVKTLILLYFDHSRIFNISTCGDNCAKWIVEISKRCKEDITANLRHLLKFEGDFEFKLLNSGEIIHNRKEYLEKIFPYLNVGDITLKDVLTNEG